MPPRSPPPPSQIGPGVRVSSSFQKLPRLVRLLGSWFSFVGRFGSGVGLRVSVSFQIRGTLWGRNSFRWVTWWIRLARLSSIALVLQASGLTVTQNSLPSLTRTWNVKKRHPCCEKSAGRVAYDRIVLSGCYVMVDRPRVTEIQVHVTTPIVDRMCMCEL